MRITYKSLLLLGLVVLLIAMTGCEYDAVKPLWEEPFTLPDPPVIESMDPSAGIPGANSIGIVGENFASTIDSVRVYFGNVEAEVLNVSSTRIEVRRPNLVSEGTTVSVSSFNAYEAARYEDYRMDNVVDEWGVFAGTITVIGTAAVDKDENVYAFKKIPRVMYKIAPDGTQTEIGYPAKLIYDMKVGPDGNLILMLKNKKVMIMDVNTGEETLWGEMPKNATYGDFDQNGNFFSAGSKTEMMVLPHDGGSYQTGDFKDDEIFCVRVFDNAVYALAQLKRPDEDHPEWAIWKMPILDANGSLGDPAVYLNWAETGDYAESTPNYFTFSKDGICYVGTDNENPILMVQPDGQMDTLYKDILPSPATDLIWGNGNYMYQIIQSDDIKFRRIDMGAEGAPYFGRTL